MTPLKAPFPYFGGKRMIADVIWQRLGDVPNYVEPMFGSGAVLLARPTEPKIETVNDANGYLANFYRSVKHDPVGVAEHADWPVNENDLHARHKWLIGQRKGLSELLESDPDAYNAKIAGWWVWGISCWIGGGWCATTNRQIPDITGGQYGKGIHAKGIQIPKRQIPHIGGHGDYGQGIHAKGAYTNGIYDTMQALSARFRRVRVCCGDWTRVMGPSPTYLNALTGVFLDPPYGTEAKRDVGIYGDEESLTVAADCRKYCIENGDNPRLRIALCGYAGEHEKLLQHGWTPNYWKAGGGYSHDSKGNSKREVVWFSPHCLQDKQLGLF